MMVNVNTVSDNFIVHMAVSPNGDGIDDVLKIDNIARYLSNKLTIVNSTGAKVFEVLNYGNVNRTFDGHSNLTGIMQPAGSYFYRLQYYKHGISNIKTGFVVLKY